MYTTYEDAVTHVVDYVGGGPSDVVVADAKRAVLAAYRDLANAHPWTYLYNHGRLITATPYAAGSIAYVHTGGTYERQVTLSGGSWPSWAAMGSLRVGVEAYRVNEVKSSTVLTLSETLNPGLDIPALTPYTLYQDTYLLPLDFIDQDRPLYQQNFGGLEYIHPSEWLYRARYLLGEGIPRYFTITGDPAFPGRLVLRVSPWPVESKTLDFLYRRRPRALVYYKGNPTLATVSMAGGMNVATASGGPFSFLTGHVGSIIRLAAAPAKPPPTGDVGLYPAAFESVISAYVSPSQINTHDLPNNALLAVAFTISDPIDIEQGAMLNAFFRGIEKQVGMNRTLKDKPSAAAQYAMALEQAKCADSRSFAGRHAGPYTNRRLRLRDMPVGQDQ